MVNDFPASAGSPAGNESGTRISRGSSGTTSYRSSHARRESVQAARITLAVLPPNASLMDLTSVSGIEAMAIARRLVSGALNTVCGTGPLIDDAAGDFA